MQLFLIRHPRPLLEAGICYGQLDVEAEDPQALAERLRRRLPADTPVMTSPLRRARGLAEALQRPPLLDSRLMEINFGQWEGQRWEQIDRHLLDAWAADVLHFVPPGGESVAALQARVVDCLTSLRGERVALVTHAGVIRCALAHWLQLPLAEWSRLTLDFGSLTLLEIDRAGYEQAAADAPIPAAILRYHNR